MPALSPLDGRYADAMKPMHTLWSEASFMKHRLFIESEWAITLSMIEQLTLIPKLPAQAILDFRAHINAFDENTVNKIKDIEQETMHDVKSCEIYLRQWCQNNGALKDIAPFIHFCCTSEDINNLAYSLMLKTTINTIIEPAIKTLLATLNHWRHEYANTPMLSRTHGQSASPTTLGKEISVFHARLTQKHQQLKTIVFSGKMNGAVGNYHAHTAAAPDINWPGITERFIQTLDLEPTLHTTQIEPQDRVTELYHLLHHINRILNDFSIDMWHYISLGYFQQSIGKHQVGSSTMPHKVNPIQFENAEGNLAIANSLFSLFTERLPCSRLQRDLSNSTVLRNQGVALGHMLLALQNLQKGMNRLTPKHNVMEVELNEQWALLAEPIQTILKLHGHDDAYELMRKATQGKKIRKNDLHQTITELDIPNELKTSLLSLEPNKYLGIAMSLAKQNV